LEKREEGVGLIRKGAGVFKRGAARARGGFGGGWRRSRARTRGAEKAETRSTSGRRNRRAVADETDERARGVSGRENAVRRMSLGRLRGDSAAGVTGPEARALGHSGRAFPAGGCVATRGGCATARAGGRSWRAAREGKKRESGRAEMRRKRGREGRIRPSAEK